MLTENLFFVPFLSFAEIVNTVTNLVSRLKGQAMGSGNASIEAAMTAASFIIAFQLIKLSYDIMSDEQQGGFGGIRLWQVLRPILLLILIANASTVFKLIDDSTKWVSDKISANIRGEKSAQVYYDKMRTLYTDLSTDKFGNDILSLDKDYYRSQDIAIQTEEWLKEQKKKQGWWDNLKDDISGRSGKAAHDKMEELKSKYYVDNLLENFDAHQGSLDETSKRIYNSLKEIKDSGYVNSEENNKKIKAIFKELRTRKTEEEIANFSKIRDIVKLSWGELIAWMAGKIYDIMMFCIILFADIQMLVLAIFFPWALVLSLFTHYKNAIWHYITSYLTIAMTKIVAQSINWAISNTVIAMSDYTLGSMLQNLADVNEQYGAVKGTTLGAALVYLTGFIALTKCGSIVNMLIPGASSASDAAAGGLAAAGMVKSGAMKAGGAAASGIGKVGSTIASGGLFAASRATRATKAFQSNVTNALGKIANKSGGGGGGRSSTPMNWNSSPGADGVSE